TLAGRTVDRAYAVISFDDGYRNALTAAAPIATRFGVRPAMFVNGAFAEGVVYFRVLAAVLTANGHADALRSELRSRMRRISWSADPQALFDQTKNAYERG